MLLRCAAARANRTSARASLSGEGNAAAGALGHRLGGGGPTQVTKLHDRPPPLSSPLPHVRVRADCAMEADRLPLARGASGNFAEECRVLFWPLPPAPGGLRRPGRAGVAGAGGRGSGLGRVLHLGRVDPRIRVRHGPSEDAGGWRRRLARRGRTDSQPHRSRRRHRAHRFGSLVTPVARLQPEVFAHQTVALDRFSGGRLVVGVGLGNPDTQFTAFGNDADPRKRAARVDEFLELLVELWSGRTTDFQGEYYTARGIALPRALQSPRIGCLRERRRRR